MDGVVEKRKVVQMKNVPDQTPHKIPTSKQLRGVGGIR
jgi:hypothetical protein